MLKSLLIPSDTTVRRSTINREDLKPYWKSEKKKAHFSGVDLSPRPGVDISPSSRPFLKILKYRKIQYNETF